MSEHDDVFGPPPGPPLPGFARPAWRRFAIAVVCVGAMAGVRQALDPWFGERYPFTLFLIAVVTASVYGGVGPGLLATILGAVAGVAFFADRLDVPDIVGLCIFLSAGGVITFLNEMQRRARQRAELAVHEVQEKHELLLQESEDRQRVQEQLYESQKTETVGRLAGGIAHDFNNLLTAILGYAHLAQKELPPDAQGRTYMQNILTAGERGAELTSHLLAYARRQMVELTVIDMNDVLVRAGPLLHRTLGDDVELVTLPGSSLWHVKAGTGQLDQVLVNLAVNARDAMPNGGKLIVETANVTLGREYESGHTEVAPGEYVQLSVTDTGVGMSPEVRRHLFEPFFTTKESEQGVGLGLATVYGIVKQNRGHISVYSEPGRGTTFTLRLPRVYETPATLYMRVSREDVPRGTETVLVVEDETMVREFAALALRDAGYDVLEAANGAEALRVESDCRRPIHLLVTDVVMPWLSGPDLARKLRQRGRATKVLFVSGYTHNALLYQGVIDSGLPLLQKPFSSASLARKVRDVLDSREPPGASQAAPASA